VPNRPRVTVTPTGLLGIALVGSFVAALFGAVPLAAWVDNLPDSPTVRTLGQAADTWREFTQRVHLDEPYTALRRFVRSAEGERFGG
jgi:hypothetical protein